jgi:hypothetical protein
MFNRSMCLKGNKNVMVLSYIKRSYFSVKEGSL